MFAGSFAALLLAGSALAAAPAAPPSTEAFRLMRVFQLMPGPQRGLNVWLDEADLLAAAASKSKVKQVRALVGRPPGADGKPGGWTLTTSRYDCNRGQVIRLRSQTTNGEGKVTVESKRGSAEYPVPHTPNGFIFGLVCDGAVLNEAPRVVGIEAALAFDANEDAEFLKANPPG